MEFLKSKNKAETVVYITLLVFILIVYITGLFPETTVDSAKYAAVSRNIFETGDFIHLKIQGEPYLQKPPLLFWLAAVAFRLFGISIIAFKLPNLLFAFVGIYSVYRLGLLIYDKRTAIIAALLYSSCEAFFLYNMDVHTDLLLTSNIIFATWQLAEYLNKRRVLNFILGFTGIGLAMSSKGVIGLAVPVFAIAGYLLIKRDLRTIFSLRWLAGILILLVILYPTLRGLYDQFGIPGLKFYFWSNNFDRIRGDYSSGRHDYLFFLHTFAYVFLPWSMFAYTAFIKDFRIFKKNSWAIKNLNTVYCYTPIIILGLIISVSSQQAPHYLLPIIPFTAILTAGLIRDVAFSDLYPKTFRLMLILRTIIVILLWPIIIIFLVYFFPTRNIWIWLTILLMFSLMIFSYIKLTTKTGKLIIPLLITICVLAFVANTVYMPSALKYHGPIQASYAYNRLASDDSKLYTYDYLMFEPDFYPKNISEYVSSDQLKDIIFRGSCWIITTDKGFEEIKSLDESHIVEKHVFPYKKLTNISARFLNPATRESTLSKIYLLKIQ